MNTYLRYLKKDKNVETIIFQFSYSSIQCLCHVFFYKNKLLIFGFCLGCGYLNKKKSN